ncbi:MAG: hypothetical protein JW881_13000, partial [Spirochaetales bacterium]|nr:hypothetical protein [Spirochaetales bacterium]
MYRITTTCAMLALIIALMFTGCSLDSGNTAPDTDENGNETAAMPLAFPGQKGTVKTGVYLGEEIEYEEINGKCVFQGDIVLEPEDVSASKGAGRTKSSVFWPNRTVYFNIESSLKSTTNLNTAIDYYRSLGVRFVQRGSEKNYISFFFNKDSDGYYSSAIGMTGKKQTIHLATGYSVGTAVHEIGHALGLFHEQSRTDRDNYITIHFDNILDNKEHNFKTYSASGYDGFNFHNFDWQSIMLYPSYTGFENDTSKPAITRLDGTTFSRQNVRLSIGDLNTIYTMYPPNFIVRTDAVSRDSSRIDIVRVNGDGKILTAAKTGSSWAGWWQIANGVTAPGTDVKIVSRHPEKLDVFTVGSNNRVYTAAWDRARDGSAGFRGWWTIGSLTCQSASSVSAVVRGSQQLNVMAVGSDGGIYTAAWDNSESNGAWQGWWRIANGVATCGSEPALISRYSSLLDAFVVGTDGNVWTAAWDSGRAYGSWKGWWSLGSIGQPVATVSAIASDKNRIHVFAVGLNGRVYSKQWDGSWSTWKRIGSFNAQPGAKVYPVSRKTGYVDIFVMTEDQHVFTSAWNTSKSANTFSSPKDLG